MHDTEVSLSLYSKQYIVYSPSLHPLSLGCGCSFLFRLLGLRESASRKVGIHQYISHLHIYSSYTYQTCVVSSAATTAQVTWLRSDPELLLSRRNSDIGVLIGPDVIWVKTPSWSMSDSLSLVLVSYDLAQWA